MFILSICTQSAFVQLQKCLFFSRKFLIFSYFCYIFFSIFNKGGEAGLQVGPTFFICSYFSLLFFLKNALPFLLFHSKMSFRCKILEVFPRSLRSLGLNKLTNDFFQGARCKTSFFLVLTPEGSLFRLYYFHSYYPAYLVWNAFLTTHCDKFCT